jgi:hypothetical protein
MFFSCVSPHERCRHIKIDTEMTSDAKWPHHIDFGKPWWQALNILRDDIKGPHVLNVCTC